MPPPCEHCHFEESKNHPIFRVLVLAVLLLALYEIVSQLDEIEERVKILEHPVAKPRPHRKEESEDA